MTLSEEAKKMLGYLVAKNILGFLCVHESDTFDNLFLRVLTITFAVLPRALAICHLNKTFHCSSKGLVALVFVDALLWLVEKGSRKLASFSDLPEKLSCFSTLRKEKGQECSWLVTSYLLHQNAESGISGPRKLLATFKMSHQNTPLEVSNKIRKFLYYVS